MRLIGLMPCRNEDWILGLTARAALMWCDGLVILDHCSTDGTHGILNQLVNEYRERVCIIDEDDPTWHEMAHRQRMLDAARREGATHVATIDADELLTGNLLPDIREMIEILSPGEVLQLPWIAARPGGLYIADGVDPFVTTAFKEDASFHWSAELHNGYDFHRRHPFSRGGFQTFSFPLQTPDLGGVFHLQFLSERRLVAKQALYQMQEAIRWPGMYLGNEDLDATAKVAALYEHTVERLEHSIELCPRKWWAPYSPLVDQYMQLMAEPWQVAECQRLYAEHGSAKFAGLNLFGIV